MNTKEKDGNVIHNLFGEFHYADDLGVIKSKLTEYVTTIRQEERRAAFKDAKGAMYSPSAGTMASTEFHKGFEQMRRLAIRALEAATSETKGEATDG